MRLDLRTSGWGDVSTTTTSAPTKTTVLVVEDDPVVAGLLRAVLDVEGYGVVEAPDGHAALSLVAADWAPDIVLLDWMMPHASGLEVLEAMRARPAWSRVPVIMLTGRTSERDAVRAFAAGADDFVGKPFGPTELVARIRRLTTRVLV